MKLKVRGDNYWRKLHGLHQVTRNLVSATQIPPREGYVCRGTEWAHVTDFEPFYPGTPEHEEGWMQVRSERRGSLPHIQWLIRVENGFYQTGIHILTD